MARYDLPKSAPPPLDLVQQFVNTVDSEHGREWLPSAQALEQWCAEHCLPVECVDEVDLRHALEVRDALRLLARANTDTDPRPEAISVLNHALRASGVELALDSTGAPSIASRAPGFDGALGQLLALALRAMLDGSWSRLKACRNCGWLFYDYSSNRSATWCSMAICGNRLKTRTYRRRRFATS